MNIAIFNPAPKTGNSSFAYNLGFALTQREKSVLVVSEGSNSSPSPEEFIRLSTWEGGYDSFIGGNISNETYEIIVVDIPSGDDERAVQALAKCDELLLLLPQNKLAMEHLPKALTMIKNAKAQNSSLNFKGIVETKKRNSFANEDPENPAAGTFATISGLYPNLFRLTAIDESDEYAELSDAREAPQKVNPESALSQVFRQLAAELVPGEEEDRQAARYQKRQIQGKPLTKEGFLERTFASIFGS